MQASYQLGLPLAPKPGLSNGRAIPIDAEFDVELAKAIAGLESYNKHLYRPNTYLHKWWARRCGSTFRLILKHLVENEHQRDYYAPGGLEGKIILDPMMGGGTTLHEAIRLGANVIGADIDPIPVLQARATLSDIPLSDLEAAFDGFYRALRVELGPFFVTACPTCGQTTEMRLTLYGLRRTCECGPALFVDSTVLRHEPDGASIRICRRCHAITRNDDACHCLQPSVTDRPPLVEKGTKACETCGTPYRDDFEAPYYTRYTPLVIVGQCPQHGLFFAQPTLADLACIERADARRAGLDFGPSEDFAVDPGPKSSDLIRRGITNYLDLFSSRQLLYLRQAMDLLPSFDPLVRLNLALLASTSLEFNSMLCGYKGGHKRRPGAIRHTFSHHAYSFPYTALENNPLYPEKASGTLQSLFHTRVRRARQWALQPKERIIKDSTSRTVSLRGEVDIGTEVRQAVDLRSGTRRFLLIQGSSASLDLDADGVDYVVTDPPYFDSVQYSDLAAFFRVWLKRLVPTDVQWDYDLAESAVDPHAGGEGQYTEVLSAIFAECHRVLRKDGGRFVFTFHHWNPRGWAALTLALKHARFVLLNRYVVHSENPVSVHISNLRALTHDAILVLAPVEARTVRHWDLPAAVCKTDSLSFCEDCATALGWMLNADLADAEIELQWSRLLEQ
jgi:SAM-dependent methyltransferase